MSIETNVLVDGRWTTRRMDINHVLASNRETDKSRPTNITTNVVNPPILGLLTRTLIRSPVINWIIPARIRNTGSNDVLFLSNTALEIKEISRDGYLRHVLCKEDFGAEIMAANVFGSIAKPAKPDTGLTDTSLGEHVADIDQLGFPPQILVLALESRNLLFLFAVQEPPTLGKFTSCQRPLPASRSYEEQLGKHMAVDPQSRALAIAAYKGAFTVYALKPMDLIKEEVTADGFLDEDKFDPIRQERHFSVEGIILKMDFLSPPKGDDTHVILLLVVNLDGRSRLMRYEWDCSQDLRSMQTMGTGHPVAPNVQVPLLLIPFQSTTGFMLISSTVMAMYIDVLAGYAAPTFIPLRPGDESPEEPGESKGLALWTQWARPLRRPSWSERNEAIYLGREDGHVRFLELDSSNKRITGTAKVGILGINLDGAFASVDAPSRADDLLLATGNMGDGGLFWSTSKKSVEQFQSIPNWSPIIDMITESELPGPDTLVDPTISASNPSHSQRVFACVGKGLKSGAVCELRFGIEAKIFASLSLEDVVESLVLQVWILPDMDMSGIYILLSEPSCSSLLFVPSSDEPVRLMPDDTYGFEYGARTLAVGCMLDNVLVQITESVIHAYLHSAQFSFNHHVKDDERIILGYIQGNGSSILTAVRGSSNIKLHFGIFRIEETHLSLRSLREPILMTSEPSCLSLQKIHGNLFAFLGTTDGSLQVFVANHDAYRTVLFEHTFPGDFAVCESIALLSTKTDEPSLSELLLLCGLRNGSLQTFKIKHSDDLDRFDLVSVGSSSMGKVIVMVVPDTTSHHGPNYHCSRAIATCGRNLCLIDYGQTPASTGEADVNSIWLTDYQEPDFQQASMVAIGQADPWTIPYIPESQPNILCGVDQVRCYLARLGPGLTPQAVPRRTSLGGTPSRVIHSKHLNLLITAFVETTVEDFRRQGATSKRRFLRPKIAFVDPDNNRPIHVVSGDDDEAAIAAEPLDYTSGIGSIYVGLTEEKILGLLEWFPKDGGASYHLLVINSLDPRQDPGNPRGHIRFYTVKRNPSGVVRVRKKLKLDREMPVYAVASFRDNSIVFLSGNELVLQTLSNKRWLPPVTFDLKSRGTCVSVEEPYVHVTTVDHSFSVLRFDDDHFTPQYSDQVARNGSFHLKLDDQPITLVSDRATFVTGLWHPPQPTIDNSTAILFQAELPNSITRIRRANIKPSWRLDSSSKYSNRSSIIGSSTNGALYQFDILPEDTWRILRFIQNMALRNKTICPFTYTRPVHSHIEPSTDGPRRHMQIDGDLLSRLLDRGSSSLLGEMLAQQPEMIHRHYDFASAGARTERFKELVRAAFDEKGTNTNIGTDVDVDENVESVEMAIQYIRRILQPVM